MGLCEPDDGISPQGWQEPLTRTSHTRDTRPVITAGSCDMPRRCRHHAHAGDDRPSPQRRAVIGDVAPNQQRSALECIDDIAPIRTAAEQADAVADINVRCEILTHHKRRIETRLVGLGTDTHIA